MSCNNWIYCNICGKSNLKQAHLTDMFCTTCGVILCKKCKNTGKNCKCAARCASLKIDNDMPENVKLFFKRNINDISFRDLPRVLKFQEQQINVCQTKCVDKIIKINDMKNNIKARNKVTQDKASELLKKKERLRQIQNELKNTNQKYEELKKRAAISLKLQKSRDDSFSSSFN